MEEKKQAGITKITMNGEVLQDESFSPTLINIFFGKNGTGKTTLGRQISGHEGCEWLPGRTGKDYEIWTYNEDYIRNEVQSYGNIPGIFTISQKNAVAAEKINSAKKRKKDAENDQETALRNKKNAAESCETVRQRFYDNVWKKTKWYRNSYPEAQRGSLGNKGKFATELLRYTPEAGNEETIASLYSAAFGKESKRYQFYETLQSAELPRSPLLEKEIVSSGSTPFSEFVKALNATAWVRQGQVEFLPHTDGKCPFCQGNLPDTIEKDLASVFDRQYREDVRGLEDYYNEYRNALNNIYLVLRKNTQINFPCSLMQEYTDKIALFRKAGEANRDAISDKIKNPGVSVCLDDGIEQIIADMNQLAAKINELIQANNEVLNDLKGQQQRCSEMLWKHLAFICQGEIVAFKSQYDRYHAMETEASKTYEQLGVEIKQLDDTIDEWSTKTNDTTAAMRSMNRLLDANGFQGFHLREKAGADYAYELVRDNGRTANGLSEGEKNIIAFLYFYHSVVGSQSSDGVQRDKIVIIDDPVSSMDAASMALVAQLTRNMISICHNNCVISKDGGRDDFIRQFFCLTHNQYFFKEITYNLVGYYDCVSLYEMRKGAGNHSKVLLCTKEKKTPGGGQENYSPVKNYYDGLWHDFKETDDAVTLLGAMRGILEYYFIQVCGFRGNELRSFLLENEHGWKMEKEDYDLAYSLLATLDVQIGRDDDGVFMDTASLDLNQTRNVFGLIFHLLGQGPHYRLMMGER